MLVKNMGSTDRAVRAVGGLAVFALCFTWPHTIWGLVGLVPFSTAVIAHCPIYRLLGIRTCPAEQR